MPNKAKVTLSRSIIIDSGPLIALFNNSDKYHRQALAFVKRVGNRPLVTNLAVITEVSHLLDFSYAAQRDFVQWAERALAFDQATVSDWPRILSLLEKYQDLPADFADASLVALCERLECFDVASVDSDFTVYRARKNQVFNNQFFQLARSE